MIVPSSKGLSRVPSMSCVLIRTNSYLPKSLNVSRQLKNKSLQALIQIHLFWKVLKWWKQISVEVQTHTQESWICTCFFKSNSSFYCWRQKSNWHKSFQCKSGAKFAFSVCTEELELSSLLSSSTEWEEERYSLENIKEPRWYRCWPDHSFTTDGPQLDLWVVDSPES